MIIVFSAASAGSTTTLHCPHCRETQTRARRPKEERIFCRDCGKAFTRLEAEAQPARRRRPFE